MSNDRLINGCSRHTYDKGARYCPKRFEECTSYMDSMLGKMERYTMNHQLTHFSPSIDRINDKAEFEAGLYTIGKDYENGCSRLAARFGLGRSDGKGAIACKRVINTALEAFMDCMETGDMPEGYEML